MKKILLWLGIAGAAALLVWRVAPSFKPDPNLISRSGLHWHADLKITIKGQLVEIPADVGIGAVHADMHTHKVNDQIHIEINRPVRENDIRLGRFFESWGKQFNSTCVLDSCNGPEGMVRMMVNGQPNTEFENYLVRDKDQIEIWYE